MKFKKIALFLILFFTLWVAAWLIHNFLAQNIWQELKYSNNSNLLYWVIMKIAVWMIFPIYYVKKFIQPNSIKNFLGLQNLNRGIIYGLVASIVWVTIPYFLQSQVKFNLVFSFTLLWVITGTPIAEEFTLTKITKALSASMEELTKN